MTRSTRHFALYIHRSYCFEKQTWPTDGFYSRVANCKNAKKTLYALLLNALKDDSSVEEGNLVLFIPLLRARTSIS
jgi:hypothetical protein